MAPTIRPIKGPKSTVYKSVFMLIVILTYLSLTLKIPRATGCGRGDNVVTLEELPNTDPYSVLV